MPLRAYRPDKAPCRLCGDGFELMQPASVAPLSACPRCGLSVYLRGVQAVHTPTVAQKPSTSEAKAAGFTVLKRTSAGEYEKL